MELTEERYERGIGLKIEGRYEEAEAEFRALLEIADDAEVHRQLGLIYGYTGMFEESLTELLYAVRLDSSNVGARNDLALTYSMLGMSDHAKEEFEAVLSVDPENEVAKRNMVYFA